MERVVEHRPDHFGHAGVHDDEQSIAGCSLTSITRVSSAPAGATMWRPGSRMICRPELAHRRQHGVGIVLRRQARAIRRRRRPGRRRDPGARCACRRRRSSRARSTSAVAARRSGSRSVICDPMWLCRPTISTPARPRARRAQLRDVVDRDAELVGLQAGRDVRMAAASMSGLTRIAIRVRVWRSRDSASIRSISPADSTLIVRTPRSMACAELGRRLADAGEHDLRRNEPGAQRDVDLAAGIRVGVAAERPQQPRDRQRRVGLQRVVDRVRVGPRTPRRLRGSARRSSRRCRRRAACRRRRRDRRAARRRTRATPPGGEACHGSDLVMITAGRLCRASGTKACKISR